MRRPWPPARDGERPYGGLVDLGTGEKRRFATHLQEEGRGNDLFREIFWLQYQEFRGLPREHQPLSCERPDLEA